MTKRFLGIKHQKTWIKSLEVFGLYARYDRQHFDLEQIRWLAVLKAFIQARQGNDPYWEFKALREQKNYKINDFIEALELPDFDRDFAQRLAKFRHKYHLKKQP